MLNMETVEQFKARGGEVKKCKTYGFRKFSSIPKSYSGQQGYAKGGSKKSGINAQDLLDAAVGTEHEADAIAFLESQGYEVN